MTTDSILFNKNNISIEKFIVYFLIALLNINNMYSNNNNSCNFYYSIERIENYDDYLKKLPFIFNEKFSCYKKILVIFDLDNTITYSNVNLASGRVTFFDTCKLLFTSINPIKKASMIWNNNKRRLIQNSIKSIIDFYQSKKNCSIIGLTKGLSNRFGVIKKFPHHRIDELQSLGISFEQKDKENFFLPLKESLNFFKRLLTKGNPFFYNGILFSDQIEKGPCLKSFLHTLEDKPDLIIFFDDEKKNIYSVQSACIRLNIPIHSYLCQIKREFIEKK